MDKLKYIVNILIVALLFGSIAINKDSKLLGISTQELFTQNQEKTQEPIEVVLEDGTRVINSTQLAKGVAGFAGKTPVKIYIQNDFITKVEMLKNSETPSYVQQVMDYELLESWINVTTVKAATQDIDIVSGATLTSQSLISNVQNAARYAMNMEGKQSKFSDSLDLKTLLALFVILSGVVITFAKPKKKIFKVVQNVMNIVVLGFWCGSFLSLSQISAWLANGFNLTVSLITICLLAVAIIMPLFGKKGNYCQYHCPMGSAQELLGMLPTKQIKLGSKINKFLGKLRYYILLLLMLMMWVGVGFNIMNYEVFSAFIFSSASNVVLIMAAFFLVLSPFITRPYCRFICPTGALLTIMQKTKE